MAWHVLSVVDSVIILSVNYRIARTDVLLHEAQKHKVSLALEKLGNRGKWEIFPVMEKSGKNISENKDVRFHDEYMKNSGFCTYFS